MLVQSAIAAGLDNAGYHGPCRACRGRRQRGYHPSVAILRECLPFRAAGRDFLFIVGTSALFEIEGSVADAVRRLAAGHAVEDSSLVAELRDVGAVGRGPMRRPDPGPQDGRLATMVLQLTRSCNLHCSYCYTRPRPVSGPDRMSPRTAERAVDFLFDHLPPRGPAGVTFFGGEPLLNLPALRAAAVRAGTLATEAGRDLRFSITTNATSVTPQAAELLASLEARVTVSIDGDRTTHDTQRRTPAGLGTYDAVLSNLGSLPGHPVARATLTRAAPDPVPVVEHLLSLGFDAVGVSAVDISDPDLAMDEAALATCTQGMERLADRYVEAVLDGRRLGFSNLDGLLRTIHRGVNRDFPCGAGLHLACCDPGGSLYLCHRLAGDPDHRVGNLDGGFDPAHRDRVRALSLSHKAGCRECWARYLCGGGCHHARDVEAVHDGPLRICPYLRRWMLKGLKVYATLMAEQSPFLGKVIDPAPPCAVE